MHCERDGYVITMVWRMVWSIFVEGCIEIVWLWRAYGGMRWVCVWFIFYQFGKWPSLEDMVANVSVCVVECVCVFGHGIRIQHICGNVLGSFGTFVFASQERYGVFEKIYLSVENRW